MRRFLVLLFASAMAMTLAPAVVARDDDEDQVHRGGAAVKHGDRHHEEDSARGRGHSTRSHEEERAFRARPFEFDPNQTGIVAAAWVRHLGLPEPGDGNARFGLLLSKNGPTTTNASAGVVIEGVKGISVSELGYDVRNGGHCSGGAPRFNVVTSDGVLHFVGACTNGTLAGSPDPGWKTFRFTPAQAFPPFSPTQPVRSIAIVFDEGTDTGVDFSGLVVLDNLDINGVLIGSPQGTQIQNENEDEEDDD